MDGVATAFGYDALNQLASVQLGPLKGTWTYDAVGNRLKQTSPLGTVAYTYDAGDRLLPPAWPSTRTTTTETKSQRLAAS